MQGRSYVSARKLCFLPHKTVALHELRFVCWLYDRVQAADRLCTAFVGVGRVKKVYPPLPNAAQKRLQAAVYEREMSA